MSWPTITTPPEGNDVLKLFTKKFYLHCADCRTRMRRVIAVGHDIYSAELGYECPCGTCWAYTPYTNILRRGLPDDDEETI